MKSYPKIKKCLENKRQQIQCSMIYVNKLFNLMVNLLTS